MHSRHSLLLTSMCCDDAYLVMPRDSALARCDIWFGGKTCNNDKNLSEIQLEHENKDELVVVVEIENELFEEVERSCSGSLSKTLTMNEVRMKKMEVVMKYENWAIKIIMGKM
ncbi:hypothetical protein Tco_1508835 [Tanacetum coccineum]